MGILTLSSPIDDLGLSMRTLNALKAADVRQVGSLVQMDERQLKKVYGIGWRVINEIRGALIYAGFSIGADVGGWVRDRSQAVEVPSALTLADMIGKQKESYSQYKAELRDHFAGLAMAAIIGVNPELSLELTATASFQYADAMIIARARENGA